MLNTHQNEIYSRSTNTHSLNHPHDAHYNSEHKTMRATLRMKSEHVFHPFTNAHTLHQYNNRPYYAEISQNTTQILSTQKSNYSLNTLIKTTQKSTCKLANTTRSNLRITHNNNSSKATFISHSESSTLKNTVSILNKPLLK